MPMHAFRGRKRGFSGGSPATRRSTSAGGRPLVLASVLLILSPATLAQAIQTPERLVTLVAGSPQQGACGFAESVFYEQKVDGSFTANPFVLWGDKVLVITDMSWQIAGTPTSLSLDRLMRFYLWSRSFDGSSGGRLLFASTGAPITGASVESGLVAGQEHLRTGLATPPGKLLCGAARSQTLSGFRTHTIINARLHGYIVSRN